MTRGLLFLTGIATTLLLIFGIGYEWSGGRLPFFRLKVIGVLKVP